MSKDFWKAVGIRALRSFIEGFIGVMPASFTAGMDIWKVLLLAVETGAYVALISAASRKIGRAHV